MINNAAGIIALSLTVSLAATAIATVFGVAVAAVLALTRFPLRGAVIVLVNALLGLPPVAVGLGLYMLLSRAGPLGVFGLLFTPAAMIIAQSVLALPIVAALAHRALEAQWARYGNDLRACGASRWQALAQLLSISQRQLSTAVLAGFGRTMSEVGAVLIVGGNIAGATRSMTTTIALETSRGNLTLALGLAGVLVGISVAVSATVLLLQGEGRRCSPTEQVLW